ncbi:Asp-tRNA(Asn)/Glu-tRNA(Gln) amidotransferase GatCAB subunit A [Candidatus Wolfebacteria bacterium]|nr:MAG: Asp-tRNA(Asn)/Glu-tRNA(Gln) amidotransferase GatCAB subunit A [Candidatus Wolfebacteria bacterium]
MADIDLSTLTIAQAHEHLIKGDFSVKELAQKYLDVISEKNGDINAYLEVYSDVMEQAEIAQKKIDSKDAGVLTGIPFGIKDNILIKGRIASASSKILENYTATYDSTAIVKLKKAGAIFLGRTNMDEFAMGGSTENSAFGVTKNPHDLERVPGGSSGGSAAAVAMNGALVTIGSDTGGSVRQPASFCGVVGLKPTYGSVSRHGLIAMGSSLDVIGPMGKSVADVETVFDAIKGEDIMDATSVSDEKYSNAEKTDRKIIGVPRHILDQEGIDDVVKKNLEDVITKYEQLGYEVKDIELPHIEYALAVYYIIMPAEASSNLSRFDGVKYGLHVEGNDLLEDYIKTRGEGFGTEVRRRILLGTYVLSAGYYDAYYNKANTVRTLIAQDFDKAFTDVDLILMPTTPTPAFKIGEKSDPLSMYFADIFTAPANLAGAPAISIPSGFADVDGNRLPLGIQLVAPKYREDLLFSAGKKFEQG